MNETIKISLLQIDLAWENADPNLKFIENKISDISETDILILPEMFNTGFTNRVEYCYETMDGKTISWMKKISASTGSAICGSLIIKDFEYIYNRFVFVKPDGCVSFYNKRHLFGLGGETGVFESGKSKTVIEYKSFKILPLICYDLRFPVWSRNVENYDILFYVANWPASRQNAWDVLLKARAIENQCFVAGVNRIGTDGNNIKYNGGSCVIDFLGNYMAKANDDNNEMVSVILNKNELLDFRKNFPFLEDHDEFEIFT